MASISTQRSSADRPPVSPQQVEQALHAFFKEISLASPYAVMLGGSATINALNQTLLIGIQPVQAIRVQNQTLTHASFEKHHKITTQTLDDANELFYYLRTQTWTRHAFLFAGYGFHQYCDPALYGSQPESLSDDDDLLLIDFQDIGCFDLASCSWSWQSPSAVRAQNYDTLWEMLSKANLTPDADTDHDTSESIACYAERFTSSLSKPEFESAVSSILGHIRSGDIYQANLSLSLKKEVSIGCPYRLYRQLCRKNPSPFTAFLKTPESYLLSNSPERLLAGETQNGLCRLETRPIAGTRGRSNNPLRDEEIAVQLRQNEKEQAEHLMLVDLLRNDLGRVCKTGSVQLSELLTIERYSHVMHLVSNVVGDLSAAYDCWDALKALFPGGTITGCPKIRCIQVLQSLEPEARGFYTGSLGYLNFSDQKPWGKRQLDWNILIRTLKLSRINGTCPSINPINKTSPATLPYNAGAKKTSGDRYLAHLQVGAGIVADSTAAHEYQECYRKAQAILGALYAAEQPSSH